MAAAEAGINCSGGRAGKGVALWGARADSMPACQHALAMAKPSPGPKRSPSRAQSRPQEQADAARQTVCKAANYTNLDHAPLHVLVHQAPQPLEFLLCEAHRQQRLRHGGMDSTEVKVHVGHCRPGLRQASCCAGTQLQNRSPDRSLTSGPKGSSCEPSSEVELEASSATISPPSSVTRPSSSSSPDCCDWLPPPNRPPKRPAAGGQRQRRRCGGDHHRPLALLALLLLLLGRAGGRDLVTVLALAAVLGSGGARALVQVCGSMGAR